MRVELEAHLADSGTETEPMSDADEGVDAFPPTDYNCTPVIKLILGGGAKKISSCPAAATLDRARLRYLRFCAFDDTDGVSDCSEAELLNTTIWELQSAAVSQLVDLMPNNPQLQLWKELLPSEDDISEGDTLYLRSGPADERLLTHLYIGVKGGVLQWCTSGMQLRSMLRQVGLTAEEHGESNPEFIFCLRQPPVAASSRSSCLESQQPKHNRAGRPATVEKRVCFELAVGTKQVGQQGAPKFMRTSDAIKQVIVDWHEVPGHSVRSTRCAATGRWPSHHSTSVQEINPGMRLNKP